MGVTDFFEVSEDIKTYPVLGRYGNYALVRKNGDIYCSLDKMGLLDIGVLCQDKNLAPASVIMHSEEYKRICELYHSVEDTELAKFKKESIELAVYVDNYMYDYDPYNYNDNIENREFAVDKLAKELREEKVDYVISYLNGIISEEEGSTEDIQQAKDVLEKIEKFNSKYHPKKEPTVIEVDASQLRTISRGR